jgi:hypothetical protein
VQAVSAKQSGADPSFGGQNVQIVEDYETWLKALKLKWWSNGAMLLKPKIPILPYSNNPIAGLAYLVAAGSAPR